MFFSGTEITIRFWILLFPYNSTFTFEVWVFGHKQLFMKMSEVLIAYLLIWYQLNLLIDSQTLQSTLMSMLFFLKTAQN